MHFTENKLFKNLEQLEKVNIEGIFDDSKDFYIC